MQLDTIENFCNLVSNADTIKKGFEHIRSTAIPEALSKARSMVTGLDLAYDRFFKENIEADEEALASFISVNGPFCYIFDYFLRHSSGVIVFHRGGLPGAFHETMV